MKIFMFFLRLLLVLGLSSQMSCKTGVFNSSKIKSNEHYPAETMRQPKAVFDIWERHIQEETSGKQIQVDCMPTHFGPKEGVSSRGIVVLYHGFTACPQQYFLVAAKLAELGFDVFLPLMPGQGRMPLADLEWNGQGKDNYFDLPTGEDTSRLEHLAMQMNDMAKAG
ncbi:MAG: hypothetical protein NTX25_21590, partial [Proteobacteria bacterium]|nr:hypothetical protein [Pseudomonadota bacterium]